MATFKFTRSNRPTDLLCPRRTAMLIPDLTAIQHLLEPLFPGLMGVRVVEVSPERVVAEMQVRPDLCTAGGILHGGAYMAFADTLGAVGTIVNLRPGQRTRSEER